MAPTSPSSSTTCPSTSGATPTARATPTCTSSSRRRCAPSTPSRGPTSRSTATSTPPASSTSSRATSSRRTRWRSPGAASTRSAISCSTPPQGPDQDPHRRRGLPQRRPVRSSQRLSAIQRLRQGQHHPGRGHEALAVGVPLSRGVARLGRDPRARRARGSHRPLRRHRCQPGRYHPAEQPEPRVQLEDHGFAAAHRPGLPDLLPAEPVQQLHLFSERSRQRRHDQPARHPVHGRVQHPVRGGLQAARDPADIDRRVPVPDRHAERGAGQRRAAVSAQPNPGRQHRRAVVLALREVRSPPLRQGPLRHGRPRRHLHLPRHHGRQHDREPDRPATSRRRDPT